MRTADFDYHLPPELIAQEPAPKRDESRLLVVPRDGSPLQHQRFGNLPEFLRSGDVLVLNNSRVVPARLRAANAATSGQFEVLLLEENGINDWWAMMRPGKRARVGTVIVLKKPSGEPSPIQARVIDVNEEGHRRLQFLHTDNILNELDALGEIPLPPYIERSEQRPEDRERYQTVYASQRGSVAAPTAGLHFTDDLLRRIQHIGVTVCHVTLHVGLGTFAPVKADSLEEHRMHEEQFHISKQTADCVNSALKENRRVIAVGTTSVRVLESVARMNGGLLKEGSGKTSIFIYPPSQFHIVSALVTNFHLPKSTLLMLVSAFASPGELKGRQLMLAAYAEAVRERYRFFSYGDAMLIV